MELFNLWLGVVLITITLIVPLLIIIWQAIEKFARWVEEMDAELDREEEYVRLQVAQNRQAHQ